MYGDEAVIERNAIKLYGLAVVIGKDYIQYMKNGSHTWTSHSYVKYIDNKNKRTAYFDILGKKTFEETADFLKKLHDEDLDYFKKVDLSTAAAKDRINNISYMISECEANIYTDGTGTGVKF